MPSLFVKAIRNTGSAGTHPIINSDSEKVNFTAILTSDAGFGFVNTKGISPEES